MEIVDLSNLEAMTDGDQEFMQEMMDTYKATVPDILADLNNALANNDMDTVKARAHKLKSSVGLMGMMATNDVLQQIEVSVMQSENLDKIPEWVKTVNEHIELSIKDLS